MKQLNKAEIRNYIALILFICVAILLIGISILLKILIPYDFLGFFVMIIVTVVGLISARKILSNIFKLKE